MNGIKLRNKMIGEYKKRVQKLEVKPHLAMVQIGENIGSTIYLQNKQKMCHEIGIKSSYVKLPMTISFAKLKKVIFNLNKDPLVDGILVQFPLPIHMSRRKVAMLIDPTKDVDGVHPLNQGFIVTNTETKGPQPCTPSGVLKLLKEYKIPLAKKYVAVLGRSNISGRPLANMLINENAVISQLHSKTPKKLRLQIINKADIIITATGQQNLFEPNDVKNGVVIVDIGIIRKNGKIRGDIEYKNFANKATYITPVPGGVGPMTVAMLMNNIIKIKEMKISSYL